MKQKDTLIKIYFFLINTKNIMKIFQNENKIREFLDEIKILSDNKELRIKIKQNIKKKFKVIIIIIFF